MKLRKFMTGLALAGALALGTTAAAQAQTLPPTEGYYITPKLLYSRGSLDEFSSQGNYNGFGPAGNPIGTGKYVGGDRTSNKFGGGFAIGYDYGVYSEYPVRLELEYLYHGKHDQKFGSRNTSAYNGINMGSNHHFQADVHSLFANAYLDFPTDTNFTPYIGGGLGAAYVDATVKTNQRGVLSHQKCGVEGAPNNSTCLGNNYNVSADTTGKQNSWRFAYNLSAGLAYQIKDNMALDVSYRYSDYGKADFGTNRYHFYHDTWDYDANSGNWTKDAGTHLGTYSSKSKVDLTSHEVIFGLRITGY